jgi:protein ImuB
MTGDGSRRVASLYLPFWATDRLRRAAGAPAPDQPLALAGTLGQRRCVLAVDQAARRMGLEPGTPVAKARALHAGLMILDAAPEADRAGLDKLARWLQARVAPMVAPDPPDGIVLDTTGADHLHGGETAMLETLAQRLTNAGLTLRVALAPSLGAAHALARYGRARRIIVPPHETAAHVADLPVAALRLASGTVQSLRMLGFDRIGSLAATPRAPLTLRFGPDIARRLDQLYGRIEEPIIPVRPPEPIAAILTFAEPIGSAETIARQIAILVARVCDSLDRAAVGARDLDLIAHRVDRHAQTIAVATARPSRDRVRLTRLLCDRIETIEPGFGIERMVLTAIRVEPIDPRQRVSSLIEDETPDLSGLIDVLSNRLGPRALHRVAAVESDIPERATRQVTPLASEESPDLPAPQAWPRPIRLLPRPEAIRAMAALPDHPPLFFIWRGVRHHVARADGPERVFGEWWRDADEQTAARDYFRVEDTSGARFWVFREGDGEHPETGGQGWFLHGLFG